MTLSLPLSVEMNYTLYETWKTTENEGQLCTSLQNLATSIRTCQKSRMTFPWDLLETAYSGELQVQKVVQYEIPLLVPAALGILVALLVVIVTLFYCCCRCCGRCGARLQFSDIEYQKRCYMYITTVPLLFCITVISFTAFSSYESGIKFRRGPKHFVDTLDSSLDDLPAFVTNFGHDMSQLIRTELNRTLDMMHYKVQDLSNILAAPLTDIANPAMRRINDEIQTLENGIEYITEKNIDTNDTVENITVLSQSFHQVVDDTNTVLRNLILKCANDSESFCHLLLDPINNDLDFNMSQLLDFSEAINEMTIEVNSVNLTEIRNLVNDSVAQLPEVIHNSSRTAVTEVLTELDKIPDTVLPELDKALEFTNMTRSKLGVDGTMDSLKEMVDSFDILTISLVEKTVLPVISTYKCFLACLALVGLLLGFFFSKRGSYISSRSTASHIGSKFLLWTVIISTIPTAVFLLLSSVLLIVGGNFSVICGPLQDLSLIEKLDNGYLDLYSADELAESLDVNVSLKRFIETCKEGGTIYSGLNLVETFNLSSYINVSSFIPELGADVYNEINETIRDMNVIDTELLDNMTSSFSFENISEHSNITHNFKEELTELNLQEWSNNLTDASSLLPNGDYADAYRSLAANLSSANTNVKIPLLMEMNELENITNHLQTLGDMLRNSSQSISNELTNLQQFIQNQAVDSIFQAIDDFLDEMGTVPIDFIDSVTLKLSNDVGQCGLIWDIYDAITSSVCGGFIDSLNVFWFSFYFGGFATVMLMISSCIIMKYFRKPDSLIDGRRYHDVSRNATSSVSDNQADKASTVESNNNAIVNKVLPDWSYKVIKKKRKTRRKYCFPASESPQLMKIRLLSESIQKSHDESNTNIGIDGTETQTDLIQCNEINNDKINNPESCESEPVKIAEQSDILNANNNLVSKECEEGDFCTHVNYPKGNIINLSQLNETDHDIDSYVDITIETIDETITDNEEVSFPVVSCIENINGVNDEPADIETGGIKHSDIHSPAQNSGQCEEDAKDRSVQIGKSLLKYKIKSKPDDTETLVMDKDDESVFSDDRSECIRVENCSGKHMTDFENGLEKIQCALCKHRSLDILPSQNLDRLGDDGTGPVPSLLANSSNSPLCQVELEPLTCKNAKSEKMNLNDLHQIANSSCESLNNDMNRTVNRLSILSTKVLPVSNNANLNDAINEFDSEYDKMTSGLISSHTLPKSSALQFKAGNASQRISFINEGLSRNEKSSNNSRTSLNIKVRPYSQFYEYENNTMQSEKMNAKNKISNFDSLNLPSTSETNKDEVKAMVAPGHKNQPLHVSDSMRRNSDFPKPILTLSELATQAFTSHLSQTVDEKSLCTDHGHMTATCGHGIEKTTYL